MTVSVAVRTIIGPLFVISGAPAASPALAFGAFASRAGSAFATGGGAGAATVFGSKRAFSSFLHATTMSSRASIHLRMPVRHGAGRKENRQQSQYVHARFAT